MTPWGQPETLAELMQLVYHSLKMLQVMACLCHSDPLAMRQWAFHVLRRLADLFGEDVVTSRLRAKRNLYSLFSGVECVKHAWAFVDAACLELWGFRTGMVFEFSVRAPTVQVMKVAILQFVVPC